MICSRERQEREESNSELFQVNNVQEEEKEEEEDERFDSGGAIHQLSMLHLISAAKHRPTTKTPDDKCTACGGSMKRPYAPPSFPSSSLQEPSPKRLTLLPPSPTKHHPPSLLYRSLSEPIDSLGILNVQTAENSKISPPPILSDPSPVKNSDSRPPIPPLHRSFSDPTAALEFRQPLAPSPPRPSVAAQTIKSPPTSSAQESPNTKRLKRMKDRLRQMREWWDQVLQEEDEEEDSYAAEDNTSKEEEKGEEAKTSSAAEESVWVEEKAGEGLVIHFKCPCKKGYEILLSGNNCYYKLM